MKKYILLIIVLLASTKLIAQEDRSWGVTANIQSNQFEFLLPIWLSETTTISPSISFIAAQDAGSDISIGIIPKFYLSEPVDAVPFFSTRVGAVVGIPNNGDTIMDFIVGAGFGGEYFFKPKFSVGIELQGNLTISDEGSFRYGNPGNINFNTATALTASIFF